MICDAATFSTLGEAITCGRSVLPDVTDRLQPRRPKLTIKSLLVPLLTHPTVAQFVKWTVYLSLIVNFGFYLVDDYQVHVATLPPDASLNDVLTTWSTSIDMLAWLGLVFLFELETYALPEEAFKKWVTGVLRVGRLLCYLSIAYAAYGYTFLVLENYDVQEIVGLTDLCTIAGQGTWMQINAIDYLEITAANCASLTNDTVFFRISDDLAVTPASVLYHSQWIGWFDVINAVVWLIVVFLIEVEVWLQSHDRFSSRALTAVRVIKTIFYLELIFNALVWLLNGYPLYAWDAFLWIFGFWAIELNLAEWERDRLQELSREANAPIRA